MSVAIVTRYVGPTNYRGARIIASVPQRIADCDPRLAPEYATHRPGHWRLTLDYPYELGPGIAAHQPAMEALARRLGWFGTWFGGAIADGYAFTSGLDPYAVVPDRPAVEILTREPDGFTAVLRPGR